MPFQVSDVAETALCVTHGECFHRDSVVERVEVSRGKQRADRHRNSFPASRRRGSSPVAVGCTPSNGDAGGLEVAPPRPLRREYKRLNYVTVLARWMRHKGAQVPPPPSPPPPPPPPPPPLADRCWCGQISLGMGVTGTVTLQRARLMNIQRRMPMLLTAGAIYISAAVGWRSGCFGV